MKRRDFVTNSILAGGALTLGTLGIQCKRKIELKQSATEVSPASDLSDNKFVTEPQRKIPVFTETDVLVIAGGPTGTAAAIAASKTGANTWLIQRYCVNWNNMYGIDDQDGTNALNLSRLQIEFRQKIWDNLQNTKKTPGYEEVFLLGTASQLGVRVSRIVDAEYKLTLEDTMTFKQFKDVIGVSGAWTTILYKGKKISKLERPLWQIPYRSLVPKKTNGLLVAGRCFCYERQLLEDARMIATCLITGQGAGVAAGVSIKEREKVRDINIEKLKKELINQKVYLG